MADKQMSIRCGRALAMMQKRAQSFAGYQDQLERARKRRLIATAVGGLIGAGAGYVANKALASQPTLTGGLLAGGALGTVAAGLTYSMFDPQRYVKTRRNNAQNLAKEHDIDFNQNDSTDNIFKKIEEKKQEDTTDPGPKDDKNAQYGFATRWAGKAWDWVGDQFARDPVLTVAASWPPLAFAGGFLRGAYDRVSGLGRSVLAPKNDGPQVQQELDRQQAEKLRAAQAEKEAARKAKEERKAAKEERKAAEAQKAAEARKAAEAANIQNRAKAGQDRLLKLQDIMRTLDVLDSNGDLSKVDPVTLQYVTKLRNPVPATSPDKGGIAEAIMRLFRLNKTVGK